MEEQQHEVLVPAPQNGNQITALLDILPDALIAIDKIGNIVMSNNQADVLFGYSHEEMMMIHVDMLLPERYRASHARYRSQYLHNPQARSMGTGLQLHGIKKDGTEIPVDISLRPIRANNSMVAIAAIRDMTNMSTLSDRVEHLTKIIQERTVAPVVALTRRVEGMEQRMDIYEARMSDMQIKITELNDAAKANRIMLETIQENTQKWSESTDTLVAINAGIKFVKRVAIWGLGIITTSAIAALSTIMINYFTRH